jgi:hypothetical protein
MIESSSLGFDSKPLSGVYSGYNANEFNFNAMFLNYIDFRTKLQNSAYAIYANLFQQLFSSNPLFTGGSSSDVSSTQRKIEIELPENISNIIQYFFIGDTNTIDQNAILTLKTSFEILLNCPKKEILEKFIKIDNNKKSTPIVDATLYSLYSKYPLIFHIYPGLFIDERNAFLTKNKMTEFTFIENYNKEYSTLEETEIEPYIPRDTISENPVLDKTPELEDNRNLLEEETVGQQPILAKGGMKKTNKKRRIYRNKKTNKKRRTYRNKKYFRKTRKY